MAPLPAPAPEPIGTRGPRQGWRARVRPAPFLLLVLLMAAPVAAQPTPTAPPAPPAPAGDPSQATPPPAAEPAPAPAAQAVEFATPAGALLMSVLPARTGEFELLLDLFAQALAKSGDETAKKLAAGWRVYKAGETAPGGANVLYVVLIDPALPATDYSWQAILSTIVAVFPEKAQEVFEKGTSVHAGPMNKLTLTRLPPTP